MRSFVLCLLSFVLPFALTAAPVSSNEASRAARAWVSRGKTLGAKFGKSVARVHTHVTTNGTSFYVVGMQGGGTVFFSSDTEITPVIGFTSEERDFSTLDPREPLWALLNRDVSIRGDGTRSPRLKLKSASGANSVLSKNAETWSALLSEVDDTNTPRLAFASAIGEDSGVGDLRVPALIKSKWSQSTVWNPSTRSYKACYNYYTPNGATPSAFVEGSADNIVCGCVATSMSQVMRYHKYPTTSVTPVTRSCDWNVTTISLTTQGGIYDWDAMTLVPEGASMTTANYQAIGKLTSDAGISVYMSYNYQGSGGSGAYSFDIVLALTGVWGYKSAVYFDWSDLNTTTLSASDRIAALRNSLFANFDAGYPTCMGIPGHSIVADGYGFNGDYDYVHLNMGWAGTDDFWYNLPDVTEAGSYFTSVDEIIYNIFPEQGSNSGVVSGRVLDGDGAAVSGVTVEIRNGDTTAATVVSSSTGVWGAVVPAATYTIIATAADGKTRGSLAGVVVKKPTTYQDSYAGRSYPCVRTVANIGNSWGNDITLVTTPTSDAKFTVTPYLQHPGADAMTVLFFTDKSCDATVKCWPAEAGNGVVTQTLTAVCEKATALVGNGHSSDVPAHETQYRHRVRFEGLKPGTKYAYEVRIDEDAVYANFFRTAPGRDTPVKFVAYSDSETVPPDFVDTTGNNKADEYGRTKQWEVLEGGKDVTKTYHVSRSEGFASNIVHMSAWEPDLIVIAGDLVARGGVQTFWDEFWKENAGGLGLGYNDPAGSTPILATLGNHDFYDNKNVAALNFNINQHGEFALAKYLTYFEFNPNGVDYAHAPAAEKDTRDLSKLFHREDYGPVALIFVDSNNSEYGSNDTNTSLTRNGSSGARSPSLMPGSLQYAWLTNNLADAQANSRFTFVVCHHCPYSSGGHIVAGNAQCALPIRELTDVMIRYGVDGWLCGHDEAPEHSQVCGLEVLPNGTTRSHTVNVYDLGSAGDGLKGKPDAENKNAVFRAYSDAEDGLHYGHLQVEVAPSNGTWYCTMTPMYSYFASANSPSELRHYQDRIVIAEDGEIVYEERLGDADESEVKVEYTRTKSVTMDKKSFLWNVTVSDERYVAATVSADDNGTATVQLKGLEETDQELSVCVYAGSSTAGKGTLVKRFVIHGVGPKPLVDEDETVSIQQGSNYVFTTILESDKWNYVVSKSGYLTVSGVKNADNTYTVTIACTYSYQTPLTVKIYYGSTTAGSGTLLKTVTVNAVAAEKNVHIRVGESESFSSSYSEARYWAAGGEGSNGGFLKVSATMNPTAASYTTYNGYSIRTSSKNTSATLTLTGESVGTETVRLARQYGDSESPKDAVIVHVTVDPYPVTVKPVLTTRKTTDAQDPTIQYEIVPATLPNGKNIVLSGALARTPGSAAGAYDVTQGTVTDENNPNFTITFDEAAGKGAFEIHDVPVVDVALTASIDYGQMLSDGKIAGSMKNSAGDSVPGTFVFESGSSRPGVAQSGKFAAVFTPTDTHFYESVRVEVEVTIRKVQLTIKASDATATYGDDVPSFDFSVTGLVNGDTKSVVKGACNYICDYKAGSDIGTYDIGVDLTNLTADNYTLVVGEQKGVLTVGRKQVTVTADNKSKEYGDDDPPLTATVDGTIGTDTVSYSLSRSGDEDLGEYVITPAGDAEQGNYLVAFKTGTFKITKAIPHAQDALTATITYGQKLSEAKVVGTMVNRGGDEVTGTFVFATSDKKPTVAESGKYFATFTADDRENYDPAENLSVAVTVEKKTLYVKADDADITYGDKLPTFTFSVTGLVNDDTMSVVGGVCGYVCGYEPGDDVDEYEIEVLVENLEADNYKFAADDEKGILTVNRKEVTVTPDGANKVYGTDDPKFTAKVVGTNGTDGVEIQYNLDRDGGESVGTYTITASGAALQGNYKVTFKTGTFTINPATPTVEGKITLALTYGEMLGDKSSSIIGTMMYKDEVVKGTFEFDAPKTGPSVVDSGKSYSATFKPNDAKTFTTVKVDVVVTVSRKSVVVTADDKETAEDLPAPAFTASYDGFVFGETESVLTKKPDYACTYRPGDSMGEYEIMPSDATAANYTFTYKPGTLTVGYLKAKDGIAAVNAQVDDGDPEHPIYTFTDTSSSVKTLTIPEDYEATAEILVVGGGGSGASARSSSSSDYQGNGGGGGEANYEPSVTLENGTYTAVVGAGGASAAVYTTSSQGTYRPGSAGGSSSLTMGNTSWTAAGGSAGTTGAKGSSSAGTGGSALSCAISGETKVYGENGKAGSAVTKGTQGASGTDGEGDGGGGGHGSASGKGGDGIVIVKITSFKRCESRTSSVTLMLDDGAFNLELQDPAFTKEVVWSVAVESGDDAVAMAEMVTVADATNRPAMRIVPVGAGVATLTGVNAGETDVRDFVWTVTVTVRETPQPDGAIVGSAITYGQTLGESQTITGTMVNAAGDEIDGTFAWTPEAAAKTPVVADSEVTPYDVVFTPDSKYGSIYLVTTNQAMVVVNHKQVTVTADNKSKEYGDEDPPLTATVVGTIGTDTVSYSLSRAEGDDLGTYTITPTGDTEQGNYQVAFKTGTFKITKSIPHAKDTLTASITYGQKLGETKVVGTMVNRSGDEVTGTFTFATPNKIPTVAESGMFLATFTANDTENYDPAENLSVTVAVEKKTLYVKADDAEITYGDKLPTFTFSVTGLVNDDTMSVVGGVCGYVCGYEPGDDVDEYEIEVVVEKLEADNYKFVADDEKGVLTVNRKEVSVTPDGANKVYGTDDPKFTAKVVGTNGTDGVEIQYNLDRDGDESVGTYTITASGAAEQGNYKVTFKTGTFTINPATPTVEGKITLALTYGETLGDKSSSIVGTMMYKDEEVSGTFTFDAPKTGPSVADSGKSYSATFKPDDAKTFTTVKVDVVVTVSPKEVVVTADDKETAEDRPAPAFTASYDGLVFGETESVLTKKPDYACTYRPGDSMGEYEIMPSAAEAANYTFTYKPGTLKVGYLKAKDGIAAVNAQVDDSDPEHPIYTFTDTSSSVKTLTIPEDYEATAEILVVGGGGSGAVGKYRTGSSSSRTYYYGDGGGGGKGCETNMVLVSGAYAITVGAGGAAKSYSGSSNYVAGNDGNPSLIELGDVEIVCGDGGEKGDGTGTSGGSEGKNGFNAMSGITGSNVFYGRNGAGATSGSRGAAGDEPGEGGQGSNKTSTTGSASSGAGADGVVVIKITSFKRRESRTSSVTLMLEDGATELELQNPAFTKKVAWSDVVVSGDDAVATAEMVTIADTTNRPTMRIVPVGAGVTTLTGVNAEEANARDFTWTVTVTVRETPQPEGAIIGSAITYGQALAASTAITGKMVNAAGDEVDGTFAWTPEAALETPTVADSESTLYDVVFTPNAAKYGSVYLVTTNQATVVVNRKQVTVTVGNDAKIFGEKDPKWIASVAGTNGTDGVEIKYDLDREAGEDAGTYKIIASGAAEQGNYQVTFKPGTFTISPRQITAVTVANATYDKTTKTPAVTVTADTYDVTTFSANWSGARVNAGTYSGTVTASGNFTGSSNVTFTIEQRLVTVTPTAGQSSVYGETPSIAYIYEPELVGTDKFTGALDLDGKTAGAHKILRSTLAIDDGNGGKNYTLTFTENVGYTIAKADYNMSGVVFANESVTYDAKAHSLSVDAATLPSGVTVTGYANNGQSQVGEYTVIASFAGDTDNYNAIPSKSATLTITRKDVTVTADNKSKEYGDDDPPLTATVVGTLGTDTVSYSLSRAKGDDLGTYTITPSGDAEQGNYQVAFKTGTFKITKAIPHAQDALTATITYGQTLGEAKVVGAMVNRGGDEVTGTFTFAMPDKKPTVAESGKYLVTFTADDTENYDPAENLQVEVTVEKKTLYVKADDAEITYGDELPTFTCSYLGFVNDDTESVVRGACGYDCDYKLGGDVGEYEITVIVEKLEADNYKFAADEEKGVLTVNRKDVTVTPNAATKVYGTDDPKFTATVAGTNGTDGVEIKYDLNRDGDESVGNYTITASGEAEQGNYRVAFKTGTFTITPATPIADGEIALTLTYGETLGDKSSSVAGTMKYRGEEVTGTFEFDAPKTGPSVADTSKSYPATFHPDDAESYTDVKVDVLVVVSPKEVTVTADDKSKKFGEDDPPLTATVVGTLGTDAVAYSLSREEGENLGEYTITPSGDAEQDNYQVTFETGVLTIESESEVGFAEDSHVVAEGSNVVLRIAGGNGACASTVQLNAIYATATAADLDLKNVFVDGVAVTGFKFPYTLAWDADEIGDRIVVIPVKVDTAKETDEFLTFRLQNPMNTHIAGSDEGGTDAGICYVVIPGSGVPEGKVNVLAVPNDATRGKATGSALVQIGKKVTLKATANKGYVFTGWYVDGSLVSRLASYAVTPTNDVEFVANFATQAEDALELGDFLPAEIAVNALYSNDVARAVRSSSPPTISVTGLPTGLKFDKKNNSIFGTPTKVTTSQVKVTVSNASGRKIVRTYAVSVVSGAASSKPATCVKADAEYYAVTLTRDNDLAGTVTGAGVYQAGKKVTLKATANKGFVFTGWYALDNRVSRLASHAFTMPTNDVAYEARFVTAEEDAASICASVNGMPLSDAAFATNVMCGVALQWPVVAEALSQPTVTVGNLPTGLKFTAKPVTAKVREGTKTVTVTNVPANTIYGVPTSVQTKTVKVTVTTSGKSKRVYELKITVDPLPAYAQGSFDGPVNLGNGTTNGVATLTVAANGKVSGSVQQIENGKNVKYTLTATSLSDYDLKSGVFTLQPTYKAGSVTKIIELKLPANEADERLGIVAGGSDDFSLALYQNVWKNSATKGDPEVAPEIVTRKWTEDSLTLTLKKGGVLSVAGKLSSEVDGSQVSVSGTSQVFYVPEEDVYKAVIYLAPKTKFAGLAEIIEIGE